MKKYETREKNTAVITIIASLFVIGLLTTGSLLVRTPTIAADSPIPVAVAETITPVLQPAYTPTPVQPPIPSTPETPKQTLTIADAERSIDLWNDMVTEQWTELHPEEPATFEPAAKPEQTIMLEPTKSPGPKQPVQAVIASPTSLVQSQRETRQYSENDIIVTCKMIYGESPDCNPSEQALCAWCVLNRLDYGRWGNSIEEIVRAKNQFFGFRENNPVTPEIRAVVEQVFAEWANGGEALTLPPYALTNDYVFFTGDGIHNYFR